MASETSPSMFSGIEHLNIYGGKFTQVLGDYIDHEETDSNNETARAPQDGGPTSIQVGGDYHHHVHHHHYPPHNHHDVDYSDDPDIFIEVSSILVDAPHYHVYRGDEIMFCTRFSPVYWENNFPEFPSLSQMKKYARIVLNNIDAGMYHDMGPKRRPERYFRRYMPGIYALRSRYSSSPPPRHNKNNVTNNVPPHDFSYLENNKENINMYPCMHAHAAAHKSSAHTTSPRDALFSHLDHSGVK